VAEQVAVANGPPDASTYEEAQVAEVVVEKNIGEKLWDVFNGLTEVRVFTIVDDVPVGISIDDNRTTASFKPVDPETSALITIFNLIDGDVINVVAPSLADNAALRAFHASQVEKSLAVLPANIDALVKLGKAIREEFS